MLDNYIYCWQIDSSMEEQTLAQGDEQQQCIFCHIVTGNVASRKVFEDDKVIAVLDINPANPGHVVLIPKTHYMIMPQIPDMELEHIAMVTKAISHALIRALKAQGTNIFIANGGAAGQRAQHFMVHIIPRMENDGLHFELPEHKMKEKDVELLQKAFTGKEITKEEAEAAKKEPEEEAEEEIEEKEEEKAEKKKPEKKTTKKVKKSKKKAKPAKEEETEKPSLDDISRMITGQ